MDISDMEAFWELTQAVGPCMLTCRDGAVLHSRPMRAHIDRETHQFRFLTRRTTHPAEGIAADPQVNVAFSAPFADRHVSIAGQAYLTDDHRLIGELWNDDEAALLGCHPDDPDIAVIRVVPSSAEIWEGAERRRILNLFKPLHLDHATSGR